jgi:hypothetical protein
MKKPSNRKTTIDPAHASGESKTHDRDQLRRRLLKMILQNEAQRRSTEPTAGRTRAASSSSSNSAKNLAVFDPEDFIGKELAESNNEQKPA